MRVDVSPRRRNSQRADAVKRCPAFLQWLRGRPCAVANSLCAGKIEAAHVDFMGNKGMATKTEDWNAVPLCGWHHRHQHSHGWGTFQFAHKFNASEAAKAYWKAWPGRVKWEASR